MRYYRITNAEGKSWVMPERNMKVGMMLYQPSSKKGKLLKTLFPLLYWNPLVRKLLHVEVCDFPFDKSIEDYLHDVFKSSYLEYAIFMGTPCKNQKVTIQVFCKCNILGYCKLTQNKDVFILFENEKQTLDYLNSLEIKYIPVCLDCGHVGDKYYTFVQSTIKTLKSSIKHELDEQHYRFVKELAEKTKVSVCYTDSDFGKMIHSLSLHLDCFDDEDKKYLKQGIDVVNDFYKDKSDFSFYHGDFTPWNTFEENGKLFVFDLEYASRSCPPYMDLFHFFEQVGRLENNMEAADLYNEYVRKKPLIEKYTSSPSILYISYLLYVFTFYSQMFDWKFPKEDVGYISWKGQLKIVLQKEFYNK